MNDTVTGMIIVAIIILTIALLNLSYKQEKKRAKKLQKVDNDIIELYKIKTLVYTIENQYQGTNLYIRINCLIKSRSNECLYADYISEEEIAKYNIAESESEFITPLLLEDIRTNLLQYINYLITALQQYRKETIIA